MFVVSFIVLKYNLPLIGSYCPFSVKNPVKDSMTFNSKMATVELTEQLFLNRKFLHCSWMSLGGEHTRRCRGQGQAAGSRWAFSSCQRKKSVEEQHLLTKKNLSMTRS